MTFTSDEATTFCSSFSSCVVSDIFSYFIFHYGTASAQLVTKTFFFSYFLNKQTTLSFWNKTRHESSKFACKPPSPSFVHLLLVGNVGATGSLVAVHFSAIIDLINSESNQMDKFLHKIWVGGSWVKFWASQLWHMQSFPPHVPTHPDAPWHESSKFACKPPSPSFVHLLLVGNVGATGSLVAVHFSATPCTSTTPHGVLPKDKRSLSKLWMEASGSWENPSKMSSSALVSTWSRSQPMFSAKLVLWRLTGSLILRSLLTYWKAGNHASWAARDQKAVIMVFTLGSFP